MVDFHLFGHFWLHLDHCVKKIFEQLKFLTFAVKGYGLGVDRAYGDLLGCWSILHVRQDVCQSGNWARFNNHGGSFLCWGRRVKVDVLIGLIKMISRWYTSCEKLRNLIWRIVVSCHHVMNVMIREITNLVPSSSFISQIVPSILITLHFGVNFRSLN